MCTIAADAAQTVLHETRHQTGRICWQMMWQRRLLLLSFAHILFCTAFHSSQPPRTVCKATISDVEHATLQGLAGVKLRSAEARDLPAASTLCVESFSGPWPWYLRPRKIRQVHCHTSIER
jgi:hypothetical protein